MRLSFIIVISFIFLTACASEEKRLEGKRMPALTGSSGYVVDSNFAATSLSLPASVTNANWEQSGGNAAHNMTHLAANLNGLQQVWREDSKGEYDKQSTEAPIVAAGRLFRISRNGVITAHELATGQVLWDFELTSEGEEEESLLGSQISYTNGVIYAVDGAKTLTALNAANGKVLWRKMLSGLLRTAPTLYQDTAYIITAEGRIIAIDVKTQTGLWQTDPLEDPVAGWFGQPALAVDDTHVIAALPNGRVEALDRFTGKSIWYDEVSRGQIVLSRITLADIQAAPILDRGIVYIAGTAGPLVALRLSDGQRLWQRQIGTKYDLWTAGGLVYVLSEDSLLALSRTTGKIRWVADVNAKLDDAQKWFAPQLVDGVILIASHEGLLRGFDPLSGALIFTKDTDDDITTRPTITAGTVLISGDDGEISGWR